MKKVDQILSDGNVVLDYDQPLSSKEIDELFMTFSAMDALPKASSMFFSEDLACS